MAFKQFQKIRLNTDDDVTAKNINSLQDNVLNCIKQITGKDILDVSYCKNVQLTFGLNRVPHNLGRRLQGWFIVRTHGSMPFVYDVQDTNASPDLLLDLVSSSETMTVDLLVF